LVAVVLLSISWFALVVLARRLRAHPDVPARAKVAVTFAGLWLLSSIDLIPDSCPSSAHSMTSSSSRWDGDPSTDCSGDADRRGHLP
jgi:hypothetical protein